MLDIAYFNHKVAYNHFSDQFSVIKIKNSQLSVSIKKGQNSSYSDFGQNFASLCSLQYKLEINLESCFGKISTLRIHFKNKILFCNWFAYLKSLLKVVD